MFALSADKVCLRASAVELLSSGSQNIYECQFTFSDHWEGVDKTAVFTAGDVSISVVLSLENECLIPWEVLQTPGVPLYIGVYGTRGGEIIMPTVAVNVGVIQRGTAMGHANEPPTQDVYDQILGIAADAAATAKSVREDADAGKFIGPVGPQGPRGEGVPEGGTAGQILGKTGEGNAWIDPPVSLPEGGTPGQILTKTEDGEAWADATESAVQPDWSQNDPEARDYVKNRTHWVETGEEVVTLYDGLVAEGAVVSTLMEAGKEYTAMFNGTETYTAVAKAGLFEGGVPCVYIGNGAFVGVSEVDTGETYIAGTAEYEGQNMIIIFALNASGEVDKTMTAKLTHNAVTENYHRIDPKFLPDGVGYVLKGEMVDILPETTLTDADDGTNGWVYGGSIWQAPAPPFSESLVIGDTYTVTVDGVDYQCECQTVSADGITIPALGNVGVFMDTVDTGEPFAVVEHPADIAAEADFYAVLASTTGATSMTISIRKDCTVIQPMDVRCMPKELEGGYGSIGHSDNAVLMDTTLELDSSFDGDVHGYPQYLGIQLGSDLVEGNTYKVIWDGVEYECTAMYSKFFDGNTLKTDKFGFAQTGSAYISLGVYAVVWENGKYGDNGLLPSENLTPTFKLIGEGPGPVPIDPKFIPQATSTTLGGIKADPAEEGDTQPVRLGTDGKLYTAAVLPAYTEADDGKILGVVDGALAWVEQKTVLYTALYDGTLTLAAGENISSVDLEPVPVLVAGRTYTVMIGSDSYERTAAVYNSNQVSLGNQMLLGTGDDTGDDTGEPFLLWYGTQIDGTAFCNFVYDDSMIGEKRVQILEKRESV